MDRPGCERARSSRDPACAAAVATIRPRSRAQAATTDLRRRASREGFMAIGRMESTQEQRSVQNCGGSLPKGFGPVEEDQRSLPGPLIQQRAEGRERRSIDSDRLWTPLRLDKVCRSPRHRGRLQTATLAGGGASILATGLSRPAMKSAASTTSMSWCTPAGNTPLPLWQFENSDPIKFRSGVRVACTGVAALAGFGRFPSSRDFLPSFKRVAEAHPKV